MMPGPGQKQEKVVFLQPSPARPKNLYMVFGWRVGEKERDIVLFQKGEEAAAAGISLTMSSDGKKYFVGQHLATVKQTEGEDYVAHAVPSHAEGEELRRHMEALGISVVDDPMVYMIVA
jgi:hypothetical protein